MPFYLNISKFLKFGRENNIIVKLDNNDNSSIPPGKPINTLDFNYFCGIYRDTWLIIKNKMHISDAISSGTIAGGGVFVHYQNVNLFFISNFRNSYLIN